MKRRSCVRKAEPIDIEDGKEQAMEDRNLTIADIAQELGVSKTTVSRAISGKGRIGEQTRNGYRHILKRITTAPM